MDQQQERDIEALKALIGHEVGVSPWITLDTDAVLRHAENTGDDEWLHTDPERAAGETPFGTTIVQGFLLLSQLTRMSRCIDLPIPDLAYLMNYGFERVRLVQPVPVGSRVQGRFELTGVAPKGLHGLLLHLDTSIWMEDDVAPAVVAEYLAYARLKDGPAGRRAPA
jgi:acyl dehydratase